VLEPRTRYKVSISEGSITDWLGNAVPGIDDHFFTTDDEFPPICTKIKASAHSDAWIVQMEWDDSKRIYAGAKQITKGSSGNFSLYDENMSQVFSVPITSSNVTVMPGDYRSTEVHIIIPDEHVSKESRYTLGWTSGILKDDYDNEVLGSNYVYNRLSREKCVDFPFRFSETANRVGKGEATTTERPCLLMNNGGRLLTHCETSNAAIFIGSSHLFLLVLCLVICTSS